MNAFARTDGAGKIVRITRTNVCPTHVNTTLSVKTDSMVMCASVGQGKSVKPVSTLRSV